MGRHFHFCKIASTLMRKNPKHIIVLYRDLCSTWSFLWCFIEGLGDRFPAFYTWWCITNSQKSLVKNIFYWDVLYTTQFYAFSHIFRICKSLSSRFIRVESFEFANFLKYLFIKYCKTNLPEKQFHFLCSSAITA